MARTAIYLALLALMAPYVYDRWHMVAYLLANRPGKLQEVYNIKSHEVKFADRIRNCEDVVLDEAKGLAFLSCDPGRDKWNTVMGTFHPEKGLEHGWLWMYDYTDPAANDTQVLSPLMFDNFEGRQDFHPLGIEYEPATSRLYVVNHAQSGSVIEVFEVLIEAAVARHIKTIKHKLLHAPNSIHALGDGKLLVTNDHYMRAAISPLLSKVETFTGAPLGTVVYVDTKDPDTAKVVARVPFANGVAMLNATTVAVASCSKAGVYFYDLNATNYTFKATGFVRTPASVDNLSVDSDGKLLMAGHPYAFSLMAVSKGRAHCDVKSADEEERKACTCTAPSWVAEWSPETGLKELYKGHAFCTSCTAVRDVGRKVGMVSMLYDQGIVIFRE